MQAAKEEDEREMREVAARTEEVTDAEIQALTQKCALTMMAVLIQDAMCLETRQRLRANYWTQLLPGSTAECCSLAVRQDLPHGIDYISGATCE